MGQINKTLYSFDYPEFKVGTCVTGWTWIPCGPLWHPKKCKQEIKSPCKKTRTSRFRVYVLVTYPDSAEPVIEREIQRCHEQSVGAAIAVIATAVSGSSVGTPAAMMEAAIAATPSAAQEYGRTFWQCITNISASDVIKREIKAVLNHETIKLSDWREYYDEYYSYQEF